MPYLSYLGWGQQWRGKNVGGKNEDNEGRGELLDAVFITSRYLAGIMVLFVISCFYCYGFLIVPPSPSLPHIPSRAVINIEIDRRRETVIILCLDLFLSVAGSKCEYTI